MKNSCQERIGLVDQADVVSRDESNNLINVKFCKISLLRCHKIVKYRVANGTDANGLNSIFVNQRYCGKRFGAPLYYLK